MTKTKIVDFFGKYTFQLVYFCTKIWFIWIFGQQLAKMKSLGLLQWYMAEQLNFICILLLNALIQKIVVGLIREIFRNPFRISQILSKLVQKHSYSDLPKYSKISISGILDHINFICK